MVPAVKRWAYAHINKPVPLFWKQNTTRPTTQQHPWRHSPYMYIEKEHTLSRVEWSCSSVNFGTVLPVVVVRRRTLDDDDSGSAAYTAMVTTSYITSTNSTGSSSIRRCEQPGSGKTATTWIFTDTIWFMDYHRVIIDNSNYDFNNNNRGSTTSTYRSLSNQQHCSIDSSPYCKVQCHPKPHTPTNSGSGRKGEQKFDLNQVCLERNIIDIVNVLILPK